MKSLILLPAAEGNRPVNADDIHHGSIMFLIDEVPQENKDEMYVHFCAISEDHWTFNNTLKIPKGKIKECKASLPCVMFYRDLKQFASKKKSGSGKRRHNLNFASDEKQISKLLCDDCELIHC